MQNLSKNTFRRRASWTLGRSKWNILPFFSCFYYIINRLHFDRLNDSLAYKYYIIGVDDDNSGASNLSAPLCIACFTCSSQFM